MASGPSWPSCCAGPSGCGFSPAVDIDSFEVLQDSGVPQGSCYASQPQRIEIALRNRGSSLPALPA